MSKINSSKKSEKKKVEVDASELKKLSEFENVRKANGKGHRQRLKGKFLKSGLKSLEIHEIIELILFYCVPRRDTKPIAYELLDRFGSLAEILDAPFEELKKVNYITENTAIIFKLIPQICEVYFAEKNKGKAFTDAKMMVELFKPYFVGEPNEKLLLACFDQQLKVKDVLEISRGTPSYTAVEMRKLAVEVIHSNCSMVALAHNHPHSLPEPSSSDIVFTRRIAKMIEQFDVELVDHIIIGESSYYSMKEFEVF